MTVENKPAPPAPFSQRLGNALIAFLHGLVRVIIVLAFVVFLGILLFVGFPLFYTHYVIPLQENTDRLNAVSTQQQQLIIQLTSSAATQESLTSALGVQSTQAAAVSQDLQKRVDALEKSLPARLDADETSLNAALDRLKAAEATLTGLETSTKAVQPTLDAQSIALQVLQQTQQAQAAVQDIPTNALRRELQLVKAMELLTRARLFIVQNNLGQAQGDIQAAHDVLAGLRPYVASYQVSALEAILARLDLAQGNIKDAPALVVDDLEVAWQLLLRGLPQEPALGPMTNLTPSPVLTGTLTLTPTITLTMTATPAAVTPTRTVTLTPTATSKP